MSGPPPIYFRSSGAAIFLRRAAAVHHAAVLRGAVGLHSAVTDGVLRGLLQVAGVSATIPTLTNEQLTAALLNLSFDLSAQGNAIDGLSSGSSVPC
jgi:hypothetical protein